MKHPPERPLVISQDTREPHADANDHPSAIFRPKTFALAIPRGTPYAEWPRLEVPTVREHLPEGDYSLPGFAGRVAIERKSGPDLLNTLFGGTEDSVGEARANQDRFRAELERVHAGSYAFFEIVVEESPEWLYYEAGRRFQKYGKAFEPARVLAILRSYKTDLGIPTTWSGGSWSVERGVWVSGKEDAELEVGQTLARIWSQATGGEKARDARKRGYPIPWLDAVVDAE